MLSIGRLQTIEEKGYIRISGEIHTLEIDLEFYFVSKGDRAPENFPDYTIYAVSRSGRDVPVGAAWRKVMKAGRRAGEEFFSLTVDDPSFPAPLNVAAFQNGRPGEWDITWRRRQGRRPAAEADHG